jgi:hypothetical protein
MNDLPGLVGEGREIEKVDLIARAGFDRSLRSLRKTPGLGDLARTAVLVPR